MIDGWFFYICDWFLYSCYSFFDWWLILQEIPAQGCDWWWDISSPSSKGSKLSHGKCRIKLHLSHQQVSKAKRSLDVLILFYLGWFPYYIGHTILTGGYHGFSDFILSSSQYSHYKNKLYLDSIKRNPMDRFSRISLKKITVIYIKKSFSDWSVHAKFKLEPFLQKLGLFVVCLNQQVDVHWFLHCRTQLPVASCSQWRITTRQQSSSTNTQLKFER